MQYLGTNEAMPAKVGSYKGYKYFIIPSLFGALNGYAELPKSWKDGDEDELTVHGGITFKGYVRDGASKVKVIGFDTLHAFDDHETYTIRKEDVGMKLNRPAIRREKFNLSQNKRIWRNRQKELKDIRYKYARKVYSGIE